MLKTFDCQVLFDYPSYIIPSKTVFYQNVFEGKVHTLLFDQDCLVAKHFPFLSALNVLLLQLTHRSKFLETPSF